MSVLSRTPALASVVGLVLLTSLGANARPVRRVASAPPPAARRALATRAVLAPAPVPLQLGGVRPGTGRTWAAVYHAIRRDAMPALNACASAMASARGMVHVELSQRETRRWVAEVSSARRDRALEACVLRAVDRIVVPPREEFLLDAELPSATENRSHLPPRIIAPAPEPAEAADPTEDLVAFDLSFGMPPAAPRRP